MNVLPFSLEGRRAVVTGSVSGIGRAIAEALASRGARVMVHGLPAQRAQCLATAQAIGARASAHINIEDSKGVAALVNEATRELGAVDILVCNASIESRHGWRELSRRDAEQQLAVNLLAPFELTQQMAPGMCERRWGRILMIGSVQQQRPHPMMPIYAASKAALDNLTRNLARQLAPDGVTINVLAPGAVETERNEGVLRDQVYRDQVLGRIPAARLGTPEDCAAAALFLCSAEASYVTGISLLVDGGMAL